MKPDEDEYPPGVLVLGPSLADEDWMKEAARKKRQGKTTAKERLAAATKKLLSKK